MRSFKQSAIAYTQGFRVSFLRATNTTNPVSFKANDVSETRQAADSLRTLSHH